MRISQSARPARKRWMGFRPTVRGVVMNPSDHPHGGRQIPIGMPSPVTPWGKPTLGYKTRKKNKQSDKLIVKRQTASSMLEGGLYRG